MEELQSIAIQAAATAIPAVVALLGALLAAWLRELLLRSRARAAALEATLQAEGEPRDVTHTERMDMAVKKLTDTRNPLLATTQAAARHLIADTFEHAVRNVRVLGVEVPTTIPAPTPSVPPAPTTPPSDASGRYSSSGGEDRP